MIDVSAVETIQLASEPDFQFGPLRAKDEQIEAGSVVQKSGHLSVDRQ